MQLLVTYKTDLYENEKPLKTNLYCKPVEGSKI